VRCPFAHFLTHFVYIFVSFISQVEASGWLEGVRKLLKVTSTIVVKLQTGDPIILQSPDGRDVTEQVHTYQSQNEKD
jgi:hypothetical protein